MRSDDDGGRDFEALERELRRRVDSLQGPSPAARQAAYRAVATGGDPTMPLFSSLVTAASSKAAVALATAALAVGGGAVTVAATTHGANPTTWGQTVADTVSSCNDQLGDGQHGIGQCVSTVARKHGQEQHGAPSRGDVHATPSTMPSPHPTGARKGHPAASPTAHPGGKPSGVPAGPPASLPPAAGGSHPTGPPVRPPTPSPRHQ